VDNSLVQIQIVDGVAHFDGKLEEHQHFFCTRCRTIYDLDLSLENSFSEVKTKMSFLIQGYNLQMKGICRRCQKEKE